MAGQLRRARAGLTLVLVAILLATLLGPIGAKADTDLVLGGQARIAYANGDDVRLRESPSSSGTLIRYVPEGATVDVVDGPAEDDDGNLWFLVSYDEDTGYIISDYLALLRGDDEVSANAMMGEGGGDVVGEGLIANTSGDGVRCRTEPSSGGAVITVVPEGSWVELTGAASGDWQAINCGGRGGYVAARYVSYDGTGTDNAGDGDVADVEDEDGEDRGAAVASTDSGEATGSALIANTSGDGVTCRTEAGPNGRAITVVPEGTWVELTGNAIGDWQPINCGDRSGFVSVRYVSYDGTGTDNVGDGDDSAVSASEPPGNARLGAVTGAATVAGTNGDGVNCRSSASTSGNVITIVSEGSSVSLRGTARGSWMPVVCAGRNGYVSTQFLDVNDGGGNDGGNDGGGNDGGGSATGEATVSGTNGDGVNCRTRASTSGSVIVIVPEGTSVTLRGSARGGWQPVFCGGRNGYVSSQFLSTSDGGNDGGGSGDGGGAAATGRATVTGTGNGLRCRTRTGFDAQVITVLSDGTNVSLRGNARGDWQPVVCGGRNGYVYASYLDYDGGGGGGNDGGSNGGGSGSSFAVNSKVVVTGTNGQGVRLRSGRSASSSIVTVVPEGKRALVISGGSADWVAVSYAGTSGYISAAYLAAASSSGGGSNDGGGSNNGGGTSGGLASGSRAQTTADLNLRYDPSTSAGVAAVAPSGTVVKITGGASNGFYAVGWDGLSGYMHGDYLRATSRALSDRGGSGTNPAPTRPGGGGTATGNAIVDYAMQYVGYPYVWATHGPSSFDCSGFTYWVVYNVTGKNITWGSSAQINYGTPVSRGSIRPGDLIFFQNTYTWGLSHVGIYIGGNKFVHAENESTGVVVSDLNSNYYSSRWYGARRVA